MRWVVRSRPCASLIFSPLYGAIAYNGEKINEAQGRLLTTNRIYNDGSGTVDIGKAVSYTHLTLPTN